MKTKTLKERAQELADYIVDGSERGIVYEVAEDIAKACLEYAKSIVPPAENMMSDSFSPFEQGLTEGIKQGFNSCRSQILSHLSKEEELLNKSI